MIEYNVPECQVCETPEGPAPYHLGPPESGSLDARMTLRLCEIHYWIWVRLSWAYVGAPWWGTEAIVSGLSKAGYAMFEREWAKTLARITPAPLPGLGNCDRCGDPHACPPESVTP